MVAVLAFFGAEQATAHDYRVGTIVIDHPYALPSAAGSDDAAVHFRSVRNTGKLGDRLLGARAPIAGAVTLQRATDSVQAERMEGVQAIELPAGGELRMRHDGPWRLQLTGLRAPLRTGDRFALHLRFEHAGDKALMVDVVQPRAVHRH